jgi:hypothetical protein
MRSGAGRTEFVTVIFRSCVESGVIPSLINA